MSVAQIQGVQFDLDRFSSFGFHVPGLPHSGTRDLSSTLFAIIPKSTSTPWDDIDFHIYRVHLCNPGPLKKNESIMPRYYAASWLQRVHLCNPRNSFPSAPVAFPLKLSVTAPVILMTLPVLTPVVRVLCRPSHVGIPLVRPVCGILRSFLLLPTALALPLTGALRTVLLGLDFRTRLKKPTTRTAATPLHNHLP